MRFHRMLKTAGTLAVVRLYCGTFSICEMWKKIRETRSWWKTYKKYELDVCIFTSKDNFQNICPKF